jgi:hypothetical protein
MRMSTRFPGWSVVWVALVVALFAWGMGFYGPGVFLPTLHATKDWPISTISAAITSHFLVGAAMVVDLPEVHCALGIARATIIGALLTSVGAAAAKPRLMMPIYRARRARLPAGMPIGAAQSGKRHYGSYADIGITATGASGAGMAVARPNG